MLDRSFDSMPWPNEQHIGTVTGWHACLTLSRHLLAALQQSGQLLVVLDRPDAAEPSCSEGPSSAALYGEGFAGSTSSFAPDPSLTISAERQETAARPTPARDQGVLETEVHRRTWLLAKALEVRPFKEALALARIAEAFITGHEQC